MEFCTRLKTWSKNDDELAIGDTVNVIPFRERKGSDLEKGKTCCKLSVKHAQREQWRGRYG